MINNFKKKNYIVLFLVIVSINQARAQDSTSFPNPIGNPYQLFFLQRTPNVNTIVYELNYKNGILDRENPVHVFWIRYAEKAQKTELNYMQRTLAYGLQVKLLSPENYELRFVSDKNTIMYLRKAKDNKFYVYTTINNREAILYRVYLQIDGGGFWSPNITYAELKGFDPDNGLVVSERIKIKK